MYACRLRLNSNHAPRSATSPMIPRATAIPMPALAPEPIPEDGPGILVELMDEVLEVEDVELEIVVVPVGLGLGNMNPLT